MSAASQEPSPKRRSTSTSTAFLDKEPLADSAEKIASNDDLLIEILRRLPIKSLLKFKCVSKHWLSHITDPLFCHRLMRVRPASVSGLFLQYSLHHPNAKPVFVSLRRGADHNSHPLGLMLGFTDHDSPGMRIIQSCNGLLLCGSSRGSSRDRHYYVYNPMNKQCTTLPPLQANTRSSRILGINIAFDPITSPHYKVVCIRKCNSLLGYVQIDIYSSDKGPWRLSGHPFPVDPSTNFMNGVFWSGSVHWISEWGPSMYFNVETECLKEMGMPPVPEDWFGDRRVRYFGESGGHLHLIEIYEAPTTQLDVYEMETDYSKWSERYRVDLSTVPASFPGTVQGDLDPSGLDQSGFSILCLVREHSDKESFLVVNVQGKVVSYNLENGTIQELFDISSGGPEGDGTSTEYFSSFEWCNAYQFIESLSCV